MPGLELPDLAVSVRLWQHGFFGKGTLSRSEPSWFGRTARRLGLDGGALSLEEVTEMRRARRREFKEKREQQQQRELELRKQAGLVGSQAGPVLAAGSVQVKDEPESTATSTAPPAPLDPVATASEEVLEPPEPPIRSEDAALIRGSTIVQLEKLHLHPCEAVFLHVGLGVLRAPAFSTLGAFLDVMLPTEAAWLRYVCYHYFRSMGWCVRDGIKFGVEWLVYKRGPPFQHAEYAVHAVREDARPDWWWVHANMRVVNNAKKALMLVYVCGGEPKPDFARMTRASEFRSALKQCQVRPVVLSRFTPSRARD